MQEPYMIMGLGFRNVRQGTETTGYQVKVRIPYYRGVYISSLYDITLAVDGQAVPRASIRLVVNGKSFTLDEAQEDRQARWYFGDPATLVVSAAGGLKPGLHSVTVGMAMRKSYLPPTDPHHFYRFFGPPGGEYHPFTEPATVVTRRMTLVA